MSLKPIYKTKRIIRVSPEDTLSSALSLLSSSHDVAFVFAGNTFLGVINPYQCLIVKSYPESTKVKHALTHPPRLEVESSISVVARLMIDSRMHYLPVFEGGRFIGIITARRIMEQAINLGKVNMPIANVIKNKRALLSIHETDTIAKTLSLFKNKKVSKLVVVSKELKLKGIVTYYDLLPILLVSRTRKDSGSKTGEWEGRLDLPVGQIMKTHVITVTPDKTLSEATNLILDKEIGSIIIVDKENHPIGILTTQDILSRMMEEQQEGKVLFTSKTIAQPNLPVIYAFIEHLNAYFAKYKDVRTIRFSIKGKKNSGLFKAKLTVSREKDNHIIAREEKNLQNLLSEIKKATKRLLAKK